MRIVRVHSKSGHTPAWDIDRVSTIGAAILCASLFAIFATFAILRPKSPPAPLLIELMDMNQSKADRKKECGQFRSVFEALPGGTQVIIRTFDANCVSRYDGTPMESSELSSTEDFIINGSPDTPPAAPGQRPNTPPTAPAVALEQILPETKKAASEGRAIFIVMNSDGDDINPPATLQKVTLLSKIAHVKVLWITNVSPVLNLRNITEKNYSPLGNRLIISGPNDQAAGWDRFQMYLDHS